MKSNKYLCVEGIDCRDCKHCDKGTIFHTACGDFDYYTCELKEGEVRYIVKCENFDPIKPELVVY